MNTFVIRPATTKMLAALYGVSRTVMINHINGVENKICKKMGNFWTVSQVISIIDQLGPPPDYELIYPRNMHTWRSVKI